MKKILFIILSAFLMPNAFSQYFNTTQIGMLMGNRPFTTVIRVITTLAPNFFHPSL